MRTFRNRLLILLIGLVVGAQTVTLFTALARTAASERARADEQLIAGTQIARELIRYRERQLDSAVTVLAADFGLREAIATADNATVASALGNHSSRIGAQLSVALDLQGHLIAMGEGDHPVDDDIAKGLLQGALQEGQASYFILVEDVAYQIFVASVRAPDEIGWVALGFALDTKLAREISELVGMDVVFAQQQGQNSRVLASSLAPAMGGESPVRLALPVGAPASLRVADQEYLVSAVRLNAAAPVVGIALMKPMDEVLAPYRKLAWTLGLIIGATLLAAIAAGVVLGRSAARPIQRLASGALRIARGDYSTQVEAGGGEELTELAQAFNSMQTGIADREAKLLHGARHDAATGLPNRRHAEEWLATQIDGGPGRPQMLVVVLSITNLQDISVGLGFDFSEQLVRHMTQELVDRISAQGLVARLDTMRFAVLCSREQERLPSRLVEELLQRAERPLATGGMSLSFSAVAGVRDGTHARQQRHRSAALRRGRCRNRPGQAPACQLLRTGQ